MARIVKIPLIMGNGEKATDMSSLKENFDIESVVRFFLDGKLEKWLSVHGCKNEAEAIAQLHKGDSELAKKLCEIIGVEYIPVDSIDPEEIAKRNERLTRLKQLTDDRDVIENIDLVAFDQDELARLYDQGAKKIYLCESNFVIPHSKQDLEYVVVGNATVEGLPMTIQEENTEITPQCFGIASVAANVADKIAYWHNGINASVNHNFVETKNYVVVRDVAPEECEWSYVFYSVDKRTGERLFIAGASVFQGINSDVWAVHSDTIVLPYSYEDETAYLVDLSVMTKTKLPIHGELKKCVLNDRYLAWLSSEGIQILDLNTMNTHFLLDDCRRKVKGQTILLDENLLFAICEDGDTNLLQTYDIKKQLVVEQHVLSEFDYDGPFFDQLVEFSGILYTYDTPSSISENGETTIYQIDKSNIDIGLKQVHTFETPEDMFSTTPCIVSRGRLIYVDAEHNLCMYSFSENQEVKLAEIAHYSSLHSMALLGDYVYFEDDHRVFKIDLSDFSLSEVVGKEDCE